MPNSNDDEAVPEAAARHRGQRVELTGDLEGHYVRVDIDALDCGVLEDFESKSVTKILDALCALIVGGNLPHGNDRAGLRRLKPVQMAVLINVIPGLLDIPNQS